MNGWSSMWRRAGLVAVLAAVPACDLYFGHDDPSGRDGGVALPDAGTGGVDGGGVDAGAGVYDLLYTRWRGEHPEIVLGSYDGDVRLVVTLDGGVVGASRAALAPSGDRIAYTTFDPEASGWALRVRDLRSGEDVRIATLVGDAVPSWSPDGARVAYASAEGIYVAPATGGTPTRLATTVRADACTAPRFSPDGASLSFADVAGVVVHRLADGEETVVAASAVACAPAWSPDGAALVFTDSVAGALARVDATGGPVTIVAPVFGGFGIGQAAWSPDGRQIAYVDYDYPAHDAALRVVDAGGGSPRVLDHLQSGITAGHPVWSPDATSLLYVKFDANVSSARLTLVDTASGATVALPHVGAAIDGSYPAWLPAPIVIR